MGRFRSRRGLFVLAAAVTVVLLNRGNAAADPLTFSNVRAAQLDPLDVTNSIVTDLFANPGAVLSSGTHVSFLVNVDGILPTGSTDTLRATYNQPGGLGTVVQNFGIPVFGTVYPPFIMVFGLDFPVFYHPVPIALTLDLVQTSPDFLIPEGPFAGQPVDSYTFTFSVVQPIPEPSTLTLLGGALGLGAIQTLRRKRQTCACRATRVARSGRSDAEQLAG